MHALSYNRSQGLNYWDDLWMTRYYNGQQSGMGGWTGSLNGRFRKRDLVGYSTVHDAEMLVIRRGKKKVARGQWL